MPDTEAKILDHYTDGQLKQLLALASTNARATTNWLLEVGDSEQLHELLTEMCNGTDQSAGALLEAVCSPDSTVDVLIAIKRIAKRLAERDEARPQKAAATMLYHLSIASALAYQGQSISSKEPAKILPLYKELATELADGDLAAIFEKAVARLVSPGT